MSTQTDMNKDTPLQSWFKNFIFYESGDILSSHPTLEEDHPINPTPMESERKHKCEECSYSTNKAGNLKIHRLSHTDKKTHQCPHCVQSFTRKSNMQRHLRLHMEERIFSCRICSASFSALNNLHRHESRHTGGGHETPTDSERKLRNELGPYSTIVPKDLKHQLGEMPYKCPDCPSAFSLKRSLESHLRNQKRLFSCNICEASFCTFSNLHSHRRRHTAERPRLQMSNNPTLFERKQKCKLCSYSSLWLSDLQDHIILSHPGEMPYQCPDCPCAFSWKRSFERHLRNHKRQFSCNISQGTFPQVELTPR